MISDVRQYFYTCLDAGIAPANGEKGLKNPKPKRVAKMPREDNPGKVLSTPLTKSALLPGNSEDSLYTRISWSKRMELESEEEEQNTLKNH